MPVALLYFWPNYAKIMLVFPKYATFFKIVLFKNHGKQVQTTFSLIRSRLFLLAIIHDCLCQLLLVLAHHFSERAVSFRSYRPA